MDKQQFYKLTKDITTTALDNGIFDLCVWSQVIWIRGYISALPYSVTEADFTILTNKIL